MAISEAFAGNNTANTTEWSLTSNTSYDGDAVTTDGVYQVFLELDDMVSGDELQIRIYEKVRSGGTQHIIYQSSLIGPQSPPVWVSPSLILIHGWDVTVDVIAGTTIIVDWSIRQVA